MGKLQNHYQPFMYDGAEDAEEVVVVMGSGSETLKKVSRYLNQNGGKTGVVSVHLYRPFSVT